MRVTEERLEKERGEEEASPEEKKEKEPLDKQEVKVPELEELLEEEEEIKLEEELASLRKKLEEKTKEAKEYYDWLLRLKAEFENYKKRMGREIEEYINYANENLIKDLLPVMDNFERAIKSAQERQDFKSIMEGVELIFKQLQDVLSKFGLSEFKAVGEQFDPTKHEAVMQVESKEHPENIVVEELQKGYKFNDKIIRPALVAVSKGSS